jgi:chromosome segregation ATPase
LEFPRPLGKNDGSSNGVRYFQCAENHGLFVKEDAVVLVKRAPKETSSTPAKPEPVVAQTPTARTEPAATPIKQQQKPEVPATPGPAETVAQTVAQTPAVVKSEPAVAQTPAVAKGDEALLRRIQLLETQLEELKLEKEEMLLDKEDADVKLSELSELRERVAKLDAAATGTAFESERAKLQEKISSLESENAKSAAESIALKSKIAALEIGGSAALESEKAKLQEKISVLEGENAKLAEKVAVGGASVDARVASLESERTKLQEELNAKLAESSSKLAAKEKEALDLKAKVEALAEESAKLVAKEKEAQVIGGQLRVESVAQIEVLNSKLAAAEKELKAKSEALVETSSKSVAKEAEMAALLAEFNSKMGVKEKEVGEVKSKLEALLAELNAKLAAKEKEALESKAQLEEVKSKLEVATLDAEKRLSKEKEAAEEAAKKMAELQVQFAAKEKSLEEANKLRLEEREKRFAEAQKSFEERLAEKENKLAENSARAAKAETAVQERDRKLDEQGRAFEAEKLRMKNELDSASSQVQALRLAAESSAGGSKQLMESFQKEEARLKESLQSSGQENQKLAAQISQLKTDLDQAISACKQQLEDSARKAELVSEKHAAEKTALLDEVAASKATLAQLEQKLNSVHAEAELQAQALSAKLAAQEKDSQEKIAKKDKEIQEVNAKMAEKEKEVLDMNAKSQALLSELSAKLAEKEKEAQALVASGGQQAEALSSKLSAQGKEIQELKIKSETALADANSKLVAKEKEAQNLRETLLAELNAKMAEKEKEVLDVKAKSQALLSELSAKLAEKEKEAQALVASGGQQAEALNSKLSAQEKEIQELKIKSETALADANSKLAAKEKELQDLNSKLLLSSKEVETLQKRFADQQVSTGQALQKELSEVTAQLNATRQKYETLVADAAASDAKVSQLQAQIAQASAELVESRKQLEAEREEAKTRDAARVAQAEEAVAKNKAAREQLQQVKEEAAKALRAAVAQAKEEHAKELSKVKKEAEEMVAKVRAEAQEVAGDEDVKEALEMVTLDKELLEERLEEASAKLAALQKELDEVQAERNARSALAQNVDTASLPESAKLVLEQNGKLVAALQKMKQLLDEREAKMGEEIKRLKEENEMLPLLEESVSSLEKEVSTAKEREAELKEALEERSGMDEMVEKLSDEKMTLQEKLANAEAALLDMEELHEMSKEIEENQRAEEVKLKSQLRAKDVQIADLNSRIVNMQNQSNEAAATILKFRSRMAALSQDMEQLKSREALLASREQELEELSRSLRQHNIVLQASVDQDRSAKLNAELAKIRSAQSAERLQLTLSLLPDGFFRGDLDAVVLLLAVRRVRAEAALLAAEVAERGLFKDEPLFQVQLDTVLANLGHCCTSIGVALEEGDQDHVETSAVVPLVSSLQTMVGALLDAVKAGTLTVATDLSSMKTAVDKLLQFVLELHPDAPRPSAQVQVVFDLGSISRLCVHASLVLAASAPRRFAERWQAAAVAANAAAQYLTKSNATVYPDALRFSVEEQLSTASKELLAGCARDDNSPESWAELEQKLVLFVETVNKLHDEAITGGLATAAASGAPAHGGRLAGWQLRVARVRDEIVRLLDLQAVLDQTQALLEAEKAAVESKDKELLESSRQVVMLNKKLANVARKEEVLRNQLALKDTEIEQLKLLEAGLAATQREVTQLEQEKRALQLQLQDSGQSPEHGASSEKGLVLGSAVSMQVFDRETQRYRDTIGFLSKRIAMLESRELNKLTLGDLPKAAVLPQDVLAVREEVALERRRLRMAAASACVVDLTDRAKKAAWVEQQWRDAKSFKKDTLTAKCAEALAKLGDGHVNWTESTEGKTLLAKIRLAGQEGKHARVVKVNAETVLGSLVVK